MRIDTMSSPATVIGASRAAQAYRGPRGAGKELLFSLGSLLVIAILVQTVYATVIRPRADVLIAQSAAGRTSSDGKQHQLRSFVVIIKDYEQETATILALWSLSLIFMQGRNVARNRKLLEKEYIEVGENRVLLPEDVRAYGRPIEQLSQEEQHMFLPRAIMVGLRLKYSSLSRPEANRNLPCRNERSRISSNKSRSAGFDPGLIVKQPHRLSRCAPELVLFPRARDLIGPLSSAATRCARTNLPQANRS